MCMYQCYVLRDPGICRYCSLDRLPLGLRLVLAPPKQRATQMRVLSPLVPQRIMDTVVGIEP